MCKCVILSVSLFFFFGTQVSVIKKDLYHISMNVNVDKDHQSNTE